MSRDWLFIVARLGGVSRGSVKHSQGKGGESCGYSEVFMWLPSSVSVKDRTVLALMASLQLCTDRMSYFIGSDKLSSFCNYYVEPHLPASCGAFTFGGIMRPRAKTSSRSKGDFDLVGTCEWLSYVRVFGSQAYGMLVRFFSYRVYINSSYRDTLGYEWQLVVAVIS
jgi:hypothetical protein